LTQLIITEAERAAINDANTKAIFLYGMISYNDIFGNPHHTWYRRFTNGQFGLRDENTTSGTHDGNRDD
jgi:hypothetical protein